MSISTEVNPFSAEETELLGEPVLLRVMKKMEPGFFRRGGKVRLTVLLPPDQITPDLPEQVDAAIHRFCRACIADNRLKIRRTLWAGLRALPPGMVFLGISVGLSTMFNSQVLTFIMVRVEITVTILVMTFTNVPVKALCAPTTSLFSRLIKSPVFEWVKKRVIVCYVAANHNLLPENVSKVISK